MVLRINPSFALYAMVFIPVCTLGVTFALTYSNVPAEKGHLIYISSSISLPPQGCIGALALSISSWFYIAVVYIRYLDIQMHCEPGSRLATCNRYALIVALLSCLGCCGVGSFPSVPLTIIPHLAFAFLFFVGGITYVNIIAYIDSRIDTPLPTLLVRRTCAYLSVFFFFGYFPLQFVHGDLRSLFQQVSAGCEIASFLCFLFFFLSYRSSFSALQVVPHLVPAEKAAALLSMSPFGDRQQQRQPLIRQPHTSFSMNASGDPTI